MATGSDQHGTRNGGLAGIFAILASVVRLVPHPMNFTPVGALGIFAGARLPSWQAFALPMVVMAATDLLLKAVFNYHPFNPYVYGCFLVNVLLGRLLTTTSSPWRIGAVTLLGSGQFFLVTNFGQWLAASVPPELMPGGAAMYTLASPEYPYPMIHYARNLEGLLTCYAVALPFFGTDAPPLGFLGNQMLGDLTFAVVFFGLYAALAGAGLRTARSANLVATR